MATPPTGVVPWSDAQRQGAFEGWLRVVAPTHGLLPGSLRIASADASFRRYLRIDTAAGVPLIIMDAPPEKEDCHRFARIATLLESAGVNSPKVLTWDEPLGFMLLTDMGPHTVMQGIVGLLGIDGANPPVHAQAVPPQAVHDWYMQAIDALLPWQLASQAGQLPAYDRVVLQREMQLFPDWYITQHKGVVLAKPERLQAVFARIQDVNLNAPQVYVHRDFMARNLMLPTQPGGALGVLDFQDALFGPVTYDIASLMRDAFLTWDEAFVVDITVRYWQRAKAAGLITNGPWGDWADDFGAFYRAVDYMALQRHLKILGIFARLTLRDGKPKYLADTPRFLAYVREIAGRYSELRALVHVIDEVEGMDEETRHRRRYGL